MSVELGSGRLIPGFEDQLVGAKAGDSREVNVTFPSDYPVGDLAGKDAVFSVIVKAVRTSGETMLDDDFAKTLGLQSLDQLKGLVRDQQTQELNDLTRTHMKRQLLDQLASRHDFEVPQTMVDAEHQNILNQLRHEASHDEDPQAALAEIEKDADEYRRIAERRVRLGLLLSEIGAANGVEITQQEMQRLIAQTAAQYQGEERERFLQLVQSEPMFAAQIRAPLYEDKVVDFLFSRANISDRTGTRAELEADLESEEGHVHGPGCGHDHSHDAKPKAKKGASKKAMAAAEPQPEEPAKGAVEKSDDKPKPAKPLKDEPGRKAPQAKVEAQPPTKKPAAKKPAAKKPAKKG
jgi:trigger factor